MFRFETYDVIIVDGTDPVGPGQALFTEEFYFACRRRLKPGGILVTQNGVAFMQLEIVKNTACRLKQIFPDWHFYSAAVPTYTGGIMTFAWAADNPTLRRLDRNTIKRRFLEAKIETCYYTPEIHIAAFALPRYILEAIKKNDTD